MNKTSLTLIDRHVGNRIAIRRIAIGMGQETLADQLGLTARQVQDCEQGKSRVNINLIIGLSDALGVGVPYFYEGLMVDAGADDPMAILLDILKCEGG